MRRKNEIVFQIALGKDEGEVYSTILNNQGSTMVAISAFLNKPRTSCYRDVASLLNKGLLHFRTYGHEKRYFASSPEMIIKSIDNLIESLEKTKTLINSYVLRKSRL